MTWAWNISSTTDTSVVCTPSWYRSWHIWAYLGLHSVYSFSLPCKLSSSHDLVHYIESGPMGFSCALYGSLHSYLLPSSACCLVAELCSTLCDSMDCSPPGSSVHGIVQARILEWVAMFPSRGSSQPRDQTQISCIGRWILCRWATREALVQPS